MNFKLKVIILFLSISASFADIYSSLKHVTHLTLDTFDDFITENKNVLVVFYAPWCGHCKQLAPILDPVSISVQEKGGSGKIAVVDSTVEEKLSTKYSVQGYPTLLFFSGNVNFSSKYPDTHESRELDAMVDLIMNRDKQVYEIVDLRGFADLEKGLQEKGVYDKIKQIPNSVLLYYGKPNSKRTSNVTSVIEQLRDDPLIQVYTFFIYVDKKSDIGFAIYNLKNNKQPLDKDLIENKIFYKSPLEIFGNTDWSVELLPIFLKCALRPIINFESNSEVYYHESTNGLLTYLDGEIDEKLENDYLEIAMKYFTPHEPDSDIPFGLIPTDKESLYIENIGFDRSHTDSFILKYRSSETSSLTTKKKSGEKYLINKKDIKLPKFNKIFELVKNKNYPLFYKSISPKDITYPVDLDKVLQKPYLPLEMTAIGFENIISDKNSAFFIMHFAPWCGHCKSFKPVWEMLAKNIHSKKSDYRVYITVIDVTKNDLVHNIEIPGIPTLIYLPFGNDKVKRYTIYKGSRELKELEEYIDEMIEDYKEEMRSNDEL